MFCFSYFMVLAQKGAHLGFEEKVLGNNYQYFGIEDFFNCSLSECKLLLWNNISHANAYMYTCLSMLLK